MTVLRRRQLPVDHVRRVSAGGVRAARMAGRRPAMVPVVRPMMGAMMRVVGLMVRVQPRVWV